MPGIKNTKEKNVNIDISFDFPSWLANNSEPFEKFDNEVNYNFHCDTGKMSYMKNEFKSIYNDYGNDINRAFGRYLMQYVSRGMDVFEKTYQKVN
mgnify:FL=1